MKICRRLRAQDRSNSNLGEGPVKTQCAASHWRYNMNNHRSTAQRTHTHQHTLHLAPFHVASDLCVHATSRSVASSSRQGNICSHRPLFSARSKRDTAITYTQLHGNIHRTTLHSHCGTSRHVECVALTSLPPVPRAIACAASVD